MSIEAMLSLLAFFFVLGLFLSIATEQLQKAQDSIKEFEALAEVRACALIVDAVFSNSGSAPEAVALNCFQTEKGLLKSKIGSTEAESTVLAPEVFLNKNGALATMEVKTSAHYK